MIGDCAQVVHAFVRAGLQQLGAEHADLWQERVVQCEGRLEVVCGEARQELEARLRGDAAAVDLVYLDPMFPAGKRKSALPKRRMQWLRHYLDAHSLAPHPPIETPAAPTDGEVGEVGELLSLARRVAAKVILKRADDGPVVGKPSSQVASSKIVRYDVYTGLP
jgi:hypothetical protein